MGIQSVKFTNPPIAYSTAWIRALSGGKIGGCGEEAARFCGLANAELAPDGRPAPFDFNPFEIFVLFGILSGYVSIDRLCKFFCGIPKVALIRGENERLYRLAIGNAFRKINALRFVFGGRSYKLCEITGDWASNRGFTVTVCCKAEAFFRPDGYLEPADLRVPKRCHSPSAAAAGLTVLFQALCGVWEMQPQLAREIPFHTSKNRNRPAWLNPYVLNGYLRLFASRNRLRVIPKAAKEWAVAYKAAENAANSARPSLSVQPPPDWGRNMAAASTEGETVLRVENAPVRPSRKRLEAALAAELERKYTAINNKIMAKKGGSALPFPEAGRTTTLWDFENLPIVRPNDGELLRVSPDQRQHYAQEVARRNLPAALRLDGKTLNGADCIAFADAGYDRPRFESRLDGLSPKRLRAVTLNGAPIAVVAPDCPHALFVDSLRARPLADDWATAFGGPKEARKSRQWAEAASRAFLEGFGGYAGFPNRKPIGSARYHAPLHAALFRLSRKCLDQQACNRLLHTVVPHRQNGALSAFPSLSEYERFRDWATILAVAALRRQNIPAICTRRGVVVAAAEAEKASRALLAAVSALLPQSPRRAQIARTANAAVFTEAGVSRYRRSRVEAGVKLVAFAPRKERAKWPVLRKARAAAA